MKHSSLLVLWPLYISIVLVQLIFIPTRVISVRCITTKQVKNAPKFASQSVREVTLVDNGTHSLKLTNDTLPLVVTNLNYDLPTRQTIEISCGSADDPLIRKNVDIGGTKYMLYCAPIDMAEVPSVSILDYPHKGLVGVVHRHSKIALALLIGLLITLVTTISFFAFLIIKLLRREMFLCGVLINQMEAAQHAERESTNKSLAFATASHDIRSSLAALNGIIDFCGREVPRDSDLYMNLEHMRNSTTDLVGLLNSILDTSKMEAGKMQLSEEEFYLAQVLEESVNLYYPVGKNKGIDIVLDPCDGSVLKHSLVKGDRGKIKQIMNNLLHNAIKFTSDGHIVVRAWVQKPTPKNFTLSSKKTGVMNYLWGFHYKSNGNCTDFSSLQGTQQHQNSVDFVIEVDDTGKGIPKEKHRSVFEDFVQVKDTSLQHGGTGLGLGIVKALVCLMGGNIGIMDKDPSERGTCFRFNIFLSRCDSVSVISTVEDEDSTLLPDRIPMESNMNLELNVLNTRPMQKDSHVLLFIQEGERRYVLQRFFQSLGTKVSVVDRLEDLSLALERIKHKPHLSHRSYSGKSDLGSICDSLSTTSCDYNLGEKDTCHLTKGGSDYALSFLLIIIDYNAVHFSSIQFSKLFSALESVENVCDSGCKVVWVYTPKANIEARKLDEKMLSKCELVVRAPVHGSRLLELLKLLPEFGGAVTIQGYRPNFMKQNAQHYTDQGPSGDQNYRKPVVDTMRSPPQRDIHEFAQRNASSHDKILDGKNVLVVEDNAALRLIAISTLRKQGATVESCANGEAAVKLVCSALEESERTLSRFRYDFIFMDCEMAIMDGYDATRQIRLKEKLYNVRVPIIAVTAHSGTEAQTKTLLAGMDTFISKPLNEEKLYMAINSISTSNSQI